MEYNQTSNFSGLRPNEGSVSPSRWLIILTITVLGLIVYAVGDFRFPLSDGDDTDQYEYAGYYFFKNISFGLIPHLNLDNDQTFYPYGTLQVFLPWGFERDYWYAFCYWLNGGPGPYLQFYYVFSIAITAVGTFWLLRAFFSPWRLVIVSLAVSVFNFYGLWKYPVHLNVCVGHWTILCIVATYRLLWQLYHRQTLSLPFVLLWALLHVQVLGLELGYVAGFALTFTTIAAPFGLYLLYRNNPKISRWPAQVMAWLSGEYRKTPVLTWALAGSILLAIYLYVPLTLQIAFTAWEFDFGVVPPSRLWSHPARLLIPHLPQVNQHVQHYEQYLKDNYESYGQTSPGLYLVLLAMIGFWQMRRQVPLWAPVVLMLILCLLYHPVLLPTLKAFPWFSFNRHSGRATLIYPILLSFLALSVRIPNRLPAKLAFGLIGVLMLAEWQYGYHHFTIYRLPPLPAEVYTYMERVRETPGEAVLDWPFCVVGADGTGMQEGLCPHYDAQNAVFTFRRFYDKKVVGQYFGRLHPEQIKPFLRDGWPTLLAPTHQFTAADWVFFDNYLQTNDFAGINLYPELLPQGMAAQFYARYGRPVAETRLPSAGRVQFLVTKK